GGPTAICRPWPDAGAPCNYGECGPRRACVAGMCADLLPHDAPCTDFGQCAEQVCRPTEMRCGALDAGARCLSPLDCAGYDLDTTRVCVGLTRTDDGGIADAGVCGPRPKHGEACSNDWSLFTGTACPVGDACLDGQCRALTPFTAPAGSE